MVVSLCRKTIPTNEQRITKVRRRIGFSFLRTLTAMGWRTNAVFFTKGILLVQISSSALMAISTSAPAGLLVGSEMQQRNKKLTASLKKLLPATPMVTTHITVSGGWQLTRQIQNGLPLASVKILVLTTPLLVLTVTRSPVAVRVAQRIDAVPMERN